MKEPPAAFAARLGISRPRVAQLVACGLPAEGRLIDVRAGARWIVDNLHPVQGAATIARAGEALRGLGDGLPDAAESGAAQAMTFHEARAAVENLKAARLKIELAALEGRLIEREPALRMVRALAAAERDAILAWPARAAALIAAEFGVDAAALHTALDASLRAHLTARADVPAEVFQPGQRHRTWEAGK